MYIEVKPIEVKYYDGLPTTEENFEKEKFEIESEVADNDSDL